MLPSNDTHHGPVWEWVQQQRPYLDLYEYAVLDYLAYWAFMTDDNRENAPVGQVMYARSAVSVIAERVGLSRTKVKQVLRDLQNTHGYIRRVPRCSPQRGHIPHIIQVFWTPEADALRQATRPTELSERGSYNDPQGVIQRPPDLRLVTPRGSPGDPPKNPRFQSKM